MSKPVRRFKETLEIRSSLLNRIRSHRYFPVGLLVLVVLLACCVHVWQRVRVLGLVAEVSRLKAENVSLIDDATKLNADIAALSMAGRIEKYAADTLGLAPITPDRLFALVKGKKKTPEPDDFAVMMQAIERVTRYMPVISENEAVANPSRKIRFDSSTGGERGEAEK